MNDPSRTIRRLAARPPATLSDVPAGRCWLWHAWGMWAAEPHPRSYKQRRRCVRCGRWQERDI